MISLPFSIQSRNVLLAAGFALFGATVAICWRQQALGQEASPEIAVELASRLKNLTTPEDDPLMRGLERDFLELLKPSKHVHELLIAEELLVITNDRPGGAKYLEAIEILRRDRDPAAIPLLLRFMLIHENLYENLRAAGDYRAAIAIISGYDAADLDLEYLQGNDARDQYRSRVSEIVTRWWNPHKGDLRTNLGDMSSEQLRVVVDALMQEVSLDHELYNGIERHVTARDVRHRLYNHVLIPSIRKPISSLHSAMLLPILESVGYRTESTPKAVPLIDHFPFEAILVLEQLACQGERDRLREIFNFNDRQQSVRVRLVCLMSLFKHDLTFRPDHLAALAAEAKDPEDQLVAIHALRFGGAKADKILLEWLKNSNHEVAEAAAMALQDFHTPEVMARFEQLLNQDHVRSPVWLLDAVAAQKTSHARDLIERQLQDVVAGKRNSRYLPSFLDTFVRLFSVPRTAYWLPERTPQEQAKAALAYVAIERDKVQSRFKATLKENASGRDADLGSQVENTIDNALVRLQQENAKVQEDLKIMQAELDKYLDLEKLAMGRLRQLVSTQLDRERQRIANQLKSSPDPSKTDVQIALSGARAVRSLVLHKDYFDPNFLSHLANRIDSFCDMLDQPQYQKYSPVAVVFRDTIKDLIGDKRQRTIE